MWSTFVQNLFLQWCFWSGQESIDCYLTFLFLQDRNRGLWGGRHLEYHLQYDHHVPKKHLNGTAHRPLHLLHQLPHAAHLLVWPRRRPGRGGESHCLQTSALLADLAELRRAFTSESLSLSAGQGRHGLHGGLRQAFGVVADANPGWRAFPSRLFCPASRPGLQLIHPVSLGCSRWNPKPGETFSGCALTSVL